MLRNLLREYDTDCPRAIFQMTIATVIAFRENELRSTRLGLAGRVLRALNFSVALGSDDKSGINQNHSAASASLSGDRQPVTGIQAKVTKSPLSAACLRPGNHISDQVFGASVDAAPKRLSCPSWTGEIAAIHAEHMVGTTGIGLARLTLIQPRMSGGVV